jgi:S1-C subfamily serine protease
MRFVCTLCICLLLAALIEPGWAQEEAWLGITATSGVGVKVDLGSGKRAAVPAYAKIVRVDEGGPAAAAGMKVEDIILSLDDQPIRDGKELAHTVRLKQPGSTVSVRVKRDEGDQKLTVVLSKRPKR